jgi:hypothetical protein
MDAEAVALLRHISQQLEGLPDAIAAALAPRNGKRRAPLRARDMEALTTLLPALYEHTRIDRAGAPADAVHMHASFVHYGNSFRASHAR